FSPVLPGPEPGLDISPLSPVAPPVLTPSDEAPLEQLRRGVLDEYFAAPPRHEWLTASVETVVAQEHSPAMQSLAVLGGILAGLSGLRRDERKKLRQSDRSQ